MTYYKTSSGAVAKVLRSPGKIIVMFGFRTMFFDTDAAAGAFLRSNRFYKRG